MRRPSDHPRASTFMCIAQRKCTRFCVAFPLGGRASVPSAPLASASLSSPPPSPPAVDGSAESSSSLKRPVNDSRLTFAGKLPFDPSTAVTAPLFEVTAPHSDVTASAERRSPRLVTAGPLPIGMSRDGVAAPVVAPCSISPRATSSFAATVVAPCLISPRGTSCVAATVVAPGYSGGSLPLLAPGPAEIYLEDLDSGDSLTTVDLDKLATDAIAADLDRTRLATSIASCTGVSASQYAAADAASLATEFGAPDRRRNGLGNGCESPSAKVAPSWATRTTCRARQAFRSSIRCMPRWTTSSATRMIERLGYGHRGTHELWAVTGRRLPDLTITLTQAANGRSIEAVRQLPWSGVLLLLQELTPAVHHSSGASADAPSGGPSPAPPTDGQPPTSGSPQLPPPQAQQPDQ